MEDKTLQQFQMTPMNFPLSDSTDGARCVKVGRGINKKNQTYRRPFTSAICVSLVGNIGPSLPQKKIEFGIGGDANFCCIKGLT